MRIPMPFIIVATSALVTACGSDSAKPADGWETADPDAGGDIDIEPTVPADGYALRCDGADDAVVVDLGNALKDLSHLTVELWLRPDRVAPADEPRQTIFYAAGEDPFRADISIELADGYMSELHTVGFDVATREDGTRNGARGSRWLDGVEEGKWLHVAVVVDVERPETTLFVNGVRKPNQTWPEGETIIIEPDTLILCSANGPNEGATWQRFEGAVDEIYVHASLRYTESFTPRRDLAVTDDTLLAIDFVEGVASDRSSTQLSVELQGNPEFIVLD